MRFSAKLQLMEMTKSFCRFLVLKRGPSQQVFSQEQSYVPVSFRPLGIVQRPEKSYVLCP